MNKQKLIRLIVITFLSLAIFIVLGVGVREFIYRRSLSGVQEFINKRFVLKSEDSNVIVYFDVEDQREGTKVKYVYKFKTIIKESLMRNVPCSEDYCRERFFYKYSLGINQSEEEKARVTEVSPAYCNRPEKLDQNISADPQNYNCEDGDLIGKYPTDIFLFSGSFSSYEKLDLNNLKVLIYQGPVPGVETLTTPVFERTISPVDEKPITMLEFIDHGKKNLATKS